MVYKKYKKCHAREIKMHARRRRRSGGAWAPMRARDATRCEARRGDATGAASRRRPSSSVVGSGSGSARARAGARAGRYCLCLRVRRVRVRRVRGARGGARAVRGGVFERGVGIRHRRARGRASIDHLHPSPEHERGERGELCVETAVDDFHARLFRRRARAKGLEGERANHAARPDAAHDAKLVALDGVHGVVPIRRRRRRRRYGRG